MNHADVKLEAQALGALLDAASWKTTASVLIGSSGLNADDFTEPGLRAAFGSIRALADRDRPADASAVWAVMRDASAGINLETIARFQDTNSLSPETLRTVSGELRRLTHLRVLGTHFRAQIQALGALKPDPASIAAANESFNAGFAATIEGDESGDSDLHELHEEWDAYMQGKREPYLRTGIESLDEVFTGFVPNLNLVGGRASMGKTALVAQMVWGWLQEGHRIGVFGLEDGTKWLVERHLARALGVPVGAIGASRLHEHQEAMYAEKSVAWAPMLRDQLSVYRRAGITAPDLLAIAKRWIHVKKVRAIVIDHGGEVRHTQPGQKDRYDLAVKSTMEGLRDLAHNTKTPIIVLWHLNREGAKAGQPTMESFKESGYLEAMSRTMLGLWERPQNPHRMLVTVVKATKGKRDVTAALVRDEECALIRPRGGEVLDLQAESEQAQRRAPAKVHKLSFGGGNE